MEDKIRQRTVNFDKPADEIEQDECWKREGVQILMRELRSTVEKTAWKLPPTPANSLELLTGLLKIVAILIGTVLYHYYSH
jgi:hypothetical protein